MFEGHKEVVTLLLEWGADISKYAILGAIMFEGHKEVVTLLLEWGTDINAKNDVMCSTSNSDSRATILLTCKLC